MDCDGYSFTSGRKVLNSTFPPKVIISEYVCTKRSLCSSNLMALCVNPVDRCGTISIWLFMSYSLLIVNSCAHCVVFGGKH